jgi:release factor glutamine methyltransferase
MDRARVESGRAISRSDAPLAAAAVLRRSARAAGDAVAGGGAVRVAQVLRTGAATLRAGGVPDAERDAEWLLGAALGLGRAALHLAAGERVAPAARRRFAAWCARRARREPLQYVLGRQPFRGVDVRVDRRVLIPRPETERLVEHCLALAAPGIAVDLGTGSGAIAIALAVERPQAAVWATDVSAAALAVARDNARRAGAAVRLVRGDLLAPVADRLGEVGLVVCNPPYVTTAELETLAPEVRDWEPRLALDGGPDGLAVYRRLAREACGLRPGAWIVVELGAGQRGAVERLFAATGAFGAPAIIHDYAGIERGLALRRRGTAAGRGRRGSGDGAGAPRAGARPVR